MKKKKCFRERLLNFGVGSLLYVRDKAGEVIAEIESKGEANKDKVEEIGEEIKAGCQKRIDLIKKMPDKIFESMGLATKKDIDKIKSEMRKKEERK